jgi:F420H(2)-dependent quinone reductase
LNRQRKVKKEKNMQQNVRKLGMFSLLLYNLTGGRINRSTRDGAVGILLLSTTGRKTGKKRSSSLVYIRYGSSYVVSASNAGHDQHPGWYFNLRSNPHVEVRIKDQQFKAVAEGASPALRDQLWNHLLEAAPFFAGYQRQTQRVIPIVLLHVEGGESNSEKKSE